MKKRKDKLEVELLEARALSVSATRNVERLERYEGEGASEDEEEGKSRSGCLGISRTVGLSSTLIAIFSLKARD